MKNTRLKNVLVAAGVAIFSGVLLLGVNAAIGASTPTAEPPGVGVSPTFTGLNVNGNVQNSAGDLAVSDNLAVTGNVNATGNASAGGNLVITGTSDLKGNVSDSGGSFTIGDNLAVTGTSDLQGNVSDSGGDFTIGDNLAVTGTSDLQGNVSDSGGSFTVGDNLAVTGTSDLQGNVSDSGGDFTIGDNLVVTGTSDLQGNVRDSGGSFIVDDNMTVTGNQQVDGTLTVSNDANMNGDFTVGASSPEVARIITLNGNTSIKFNTLLSGNVDLRGDLSNQVNGADVRVTDGLDVQGAIKNTASDGKAGTLSVYVDDNLGVSGVSTFGSGLNVNGDLTALSNVYFSSGSLAVGNNISAVGAVTASRFGTVTIRSTDKITYNNNTSIDQTIACNAGEELLSCGASTFTSGGGYDYTNGFQLKAIQFWTDDTCRGRARNESGGDKQFRVYAMCWNPAL